MKRALRWDGIYVQAQDAEGKPASGPEPIRDIVAFLGRERGAGLVGLPFDVVVDGTTPADDPVAAAAIASAHAAAGATWWIEADWANSSVVAMERRIAAGPPGHAAEPSEQR
jgi:hypothetical protein